MRKFKNRTRNRSLFYIKRTLVETTLWGIFETTILTFIAWIDRHIWPNFHSRFMKLMHGKFGAIIIPSTIQLERSHANRSWQTRTPIEEAPKEVSHPRIQYLQKGDTYILPTDEVLSLLKRSKMRVDIGNCFCRSYAKKHGKECKINAPIQTCMTFYRPQSLENIRESEPRPEIIAMEKKLYEKLKKYEEIGLVHQVIFFNQNNTYVVCNCCPCCCEVLSSRIDSIKEIKYHKNKLKKYDMLKDKKAIDGLTEKEIKEFQLIKKNLKNHKRGVKMEPTPVILKSAFVSINNKDKNCSNCGLCANSCYFGARNMIEGKLVYCPSMCVGCGLCVSTCPNEVIYLKRRKSLKDFSKKGKGVMHKHPHGKH
ncbi:MAG: 4Fe-4S binding protein [Promethearchaeota archaeon]